jgi:hypothetical protein
LGGGGEPPKEITMQVVKAPQPLTTQMQRPTVFLAGSIEMGKAIDWQTDLTLALAEHEGTILNPRRSDWDSTWIQRASNPKFYEQVAWEQMAINAADLVYIHFEDDTKSPITLMELGQISESRPKSCIVRCTNGFWRLGNVEIVCQLAKVPIHVYHDSEDALNELKSRITLKRYSTDAVYDVSRET